MGNVDKELLQAIDFLRDEGIDLRECKEGFDVYVSHRQSVDSPVVAKAVAKVVALGDQWEVSVVGGQLFWGPQWEEYPDLVGCDSIDGVMQFLHEALAPRMDGHGVIEAGRPTVQLGSLEPPKSRVPSR